MKPVLARPASTVLLLRDRKKTFEVFMVKRHRRSAFMGGAFVFPGGKLDDEDSSDSILHRIDDPLVASRLGEQGSQPELLGLFVAAIRETFEEAGVLFATPLPDNVQHLDRLRAELASGTPFSTLLEKNQLKLQASSLVPHARWITPTVEPRRYDTRFFLARAPEAQNAHPDQHETTDASWWSPEEALELSAKGSIQLPPPTLRTLEVLATFSSTEAALDAARSQPPPTLQPEMCHEDGTVILALPGDPLHPVATPAFPGSTRIILDGDRWRSAN